MKHPLFVPVLAGVLAWTLAGPAAAGAQQAGATADSQTTVQRPQVAAHRGGAMHRPENTLAAFAHAHVLGVDMLELDLVMTADDQLVVYHDATINPGICRHQPGQPALAGPVRRFTLAQLQQLDCGSTVRAVYGVPGFQPVPGQRMPTLEAVLAAFADTHLQFFVETKMPAPSPGVADVDPQRFARAIDGLVRRYGLETRFILQSKDARPLLAMAGINPAIRTCLYGESVLQSTDVAATLARNQATCTLLPAGHTSAEAVAALQAQGILVFSEVVDDPAGWQRYLQLGSDVLITNHPQGTLQYLQAPASAH